MLTWKSAYGTPEQIARDIVSTAMWLHTTFQEVWLWRGQAKAAYGLIPGIHSRVLSSSHPSTEATAAEATNHLLNTARAIGLNEYNGAKLPDLALLAHLQHYGAATPLLDVSTDPLIALWMAAFADPERPDDGDATNGSLFGILKPKESHWITPLDARNYEGSAATVSSSLGNDVWWYEAPDVTERLRIQRGSFLLSPLVDPGAGTTSIPLVTEPVGERNWIAERVKNRGKAGKPAKRTTDAFRIEIPSSSKAPLRKLLIERSGLTVATVYPVPWHRPYIEQFAKSYGRTRDLHLDL